jgi:hypothetical protein
MFGFDPAHTPQLELSLKGDYRTGITTQRYLVVANAFDWVDTNSDGLGDSWTLSGGTPSIVTGNGFANKAQRVVAGVSSRVLRNNGSLLTKGSYYRLRFRWRSGTNLQVRLGVGTYISLGANTGNAIFYDGILQAATSAFIQFQVSASDYIEISEVELWEIDAARIWDEGRNRSIHGVLYSGKAFQFDGASAYIDCGNNSSLQVTSAFSICFWIKFAVNGSVILSKDDNGSNRAFQIYKDSSGKINFITIAGSTVSTLTETTATIDDEIWHRVVCTYNGSTKAIYVDGNLSISGSLSGAINNATVNLFIGKLGNNTDYLSGSLSDVQIWGKALDSTDVLFDFQHPEKPAWQRNGTSLASTDLKGHWWLFETCGYYAFDYSGNRNDAGLFGITALVQQKDIPQLSLFPYSQKLFGVVDTLLHVNDNTVLRSIWNNGGKLHVEVVPYSDGEGDLGTIITKTQWLLRCEGQSSGKVKLRFIVLFSTTNGEWVTTNTEVTLKQKSIIEITYNSASVSNNPVIQVNGTTVTLTQVSVPVGTYVSDSGSQIYLSDTSASMSSFDGIIDHVQLYNNSVLKAAWDNQGANRWNDLSGNNNQVISISTGKELFLLPDISAPGKDLLGLPLTNVLTRYGINFDSNAYCECGTAPGINVNAASEDFSVSLWVRFFLPVSGFTQVLLGMQNSSTSGFSLMLNNSLKIEADLDTLKSISSSTITDTGWHFIVCTAKRNDKMKIYLDGTEVSYTTQDSLASEVMTTNSNLRLGSRSYFAGNLLKGQLGGVTLHRKILSADEQVHLYGFGKSHYSG